MRIDTEAKVSGPLFTKGPRVMKLMGEEILTRLTEEGMQRLNRTLVMRNAGPLGVFKTESQAGKQRSVGTYRRSLQSDVFQNYATIKDGINEPVVYGAWLEGESSRNMTTRFKGYKSFAQTTTWLNKRAEFISNSQVKKSLRKIQ